MRSDHDLIVEQCRLQQEAAAVRADLNVVASYDIYTAVLDDHVRSEEDFVAWLERRDDRGTSDTRR